MALGINKRVCITETKINKFYIIVDMGKQDVIWLQIKMKHLMTMQILQGGQQLTDKLLRMLLLIEIVWISDKSLRKCLAINVFHQNTVFVE